MGCACCKEPPKGAGGQLMQLQYANVELKPEEKEEGERLKLDPIMVKALKHVFTKVDVDQSGEISYTEFDAAMKDVGVTLSPKIIRGLIQYADKDGNGQLDFMEFINGFARCKNMSKDTEVVNPQVVEKCKKYDLGSTGFISPEDMKKVLQNLNTTMTSAQVDGIIRLSEKNDEGRINYTEFAQSLGNIIVTDATRKSKSPSKKAGSPGKRSSSEKKGGSPGKRSSNENKGESPRKGSSNEKKGESPRKRSSNEKKGSKSSQEKTGSLKQESSGQVAKIHDQ